MGLWSSGDLAQNAEIRQFAAKKDKHCLSPHSPHSPSAPDTKVIFCFKSSSDTKLVSGGQISALQIYALHLGRKTR